MLLLFLGSLNLGSKGGVLRNFKLLFHSLYFLKQHISSRIRVLNWLLRIFTIWKALFGFFLKITMELYVLDLFLNFYSRKRIPTCLCCQAPHSHPPTHPELICSNATFGCIRRKVDLGVITTLLF